MPCSPEKEREPMLNGNNSNDDPNDDPNAKNGLMTKVWGPAGWLFLHCVSFGYPLNPETYDRDNNYPIGTTRNNYRNFFYSAGDVFPCKYCRDSYKEFLKIHPIEESLDRREDITAWLWNIHNLVNKKLGISYCDSSLDIIRDRYESYRAKCKALSTEEVKSNETKGCIIPADGHPKKCQIEVVSSIRRNYDKKPPSLYDSSTDQIDTFYKSSTLFNIFIWIIAILIIVFVIFIGFHYLGFFIHE